MNSFFLLTADNFRCVIKIIQLKNLRKMSLDKFLVLERKKTRQRTTFIMILNLRKRKCLINEFLFFLISADNFRPYITSFQGNNCTDYINAVFVDVSWSFFPFFLHEFYILWPMMVVHKPLKGSWVVLLIEGSQIICIY